MALSAILTEIQQQLPHMSFRWQHKSKVPGCLEQEVRKVNLYYYGINSDFVQECILNHAGDLSFDAAITVL